MFVLLRICTIVCFLVPAVAQAATLENPQPGSSQSGIGVISGWVCSANQIEIIFNETDTWQGRLRHPADRYARRVWGHE